MALTARTGRRRGRGKVIRFDHGFRPARAGPFRRRGFMPGGPSAFYSSVINPIYPGA